MGKPRLTEQQKERRKRFSERLRFVMNARKIKGTELAARLGVKPVTVTDWRKGRTNPQSQRLTEVAKALGVSEAYLLGDTHTEEHNLEKLALELAEKIGLRLMEPLLQIPKRTLRHIISVAIADYLERRESTEA